MLKQAVAQWLGYILGVCCRLSSDGRLLPTNARFLGIIR